MNEIKPLSGSIWYYGTTQDMGSSVKYAVVMKDEIDGEILDRAVQRSFKRYPYLKKHLEAREHGYVLVDNPSPIAVIRTSQDVTLNAAETNVQLIAITWEGNTFWFNNSHGMMDGRGRKNVLHTIMYYYCQERYGEEVEMEGVFFEDSPIDPQEYQDAFENPVRDPLFVPQLPYGLKYVDKKDNFIMSQEAGFEVTNEKYMYIMSISEQELMKLCKSNDSTPNTGVALLLMRAIDKLFPESDKTVTTSVYADMRDAMGYPKTHLSTVVPTQIAFSKDMKEMEFSRQSTILRGMLMLTASPEALLVNAKEFKQMFDGFLLPTSPEQKNNQVSAFNHECRTSATFAVSYSGKSTFGSCDKHIHAFYSMPNVGCCPDLLIEITVMDGLFYICWEQQFKESLYFDAFIKEMELLGLGYKLISSGEVFNGPRMEAPKS
ncbi:MAG: hypothetical protein Q4B58_03995 [Bacteroidales bacterium]|nr:hypothetical protein [Bacteroidales bacterium]